MTTPENWQKSSYSGPDDGNDCLELTSTSTTLHLRESDTPTTILTTSPAPSPTSSTRYAPRHSDQAADSSR